MSKFIHSSEFDTKPFEVSRTSDKVRFFDWNTSKVYIRNVWVDCIGQPHVFLNGVYMSLSQTATTDDGLPFTINEYVVC